MKRYLPDNSIEFILCLFAIGCFIFVYMLLQPLMEERRAGASVQPTLAWTGEAGYEADGLDPEDGIPASTLFSYRIKYTSVENIPPASGYPKVHIRSAGVEIPGSPFTLMECDSGDVSFHDGKFYAFQTTLPAGDDYTYCFEALDTNDGQAIGSPTEDMCGPVWVSDIFVDAAIGSDETGDGSQARPYLTIGKGLSVAVSGQTIRVMPGAYGENIIMKQGVSVISESGADQTSLFASEARAVVTFPGQLNNCTLSGFDISGGGSGEGGVFLQASGAGISLCTISNCKIHNNTGPGIRLSGPVSLTMSDNEIYLNSCAGIGSLAALDYDRWEDTIGELTTASEGGELFLTIQNNIIRNNSDAGVALRSADGGISYRITIGGSSPFEGNHIYGNYKAGIALGGIGQATIQNNFISSNSTPQSIYYAAGVVVQDVSSYAPFVTRIQDNDICNHLKPAIKVEGASNLIIENNDLFNNGGGIVFPTSGESSFWSSRPVLIEGNRIYNNSESGSAKAGIILGSPDTEGASLPGKITITRNEIAQNLLAAIAIWVTCEAEITKNSIYGSLSKGGIHTGGGNPVLTIRQNKVHHNLDFSYGGGIDVRHASGAIENNLVYRNARGGIRFGNGVTAITHNTAVYNGNNRRGGGIVYDDYRLQDPNGRTTGSSDGLVIIRNNISVLNETTGFRLGGGTETSICPDNLDAGDGIRYRDYNLVHANNITADGGSECDWSGGSVPSALSCILKQYGSCTPDSPHDIIANPLFVNPAVDDYHLQTSSPAIGAGYDGSDLGAYGGATPLVDRELPVQSLKIRERGKVEGEKNGEIRTATRTATGILTGTVTRAATSTRILTGTVTRAATGTRILTGTVTRIIRVTDNFCQDAYPHLQGDLLTWQTFMYQSSGERREKNWEIFVCHLPTETVTRITNNDSDDIAPQTNGQYVVWQGRGETSGEIFLYKCGGTGTLSIIRITNDTSENISEDYFPQIRGDWVVWSSQLLKEEVLQPGEILLYRISTATTFNLSRLVDQNNTWNDTFPRIHETPQGTLVSWSREAGEDSMGEDSILYLYDLHNLDHFGDPGYFPGPAPDDFVWPEDRQVSENLSVVSRYDGQDREIFVYRPKVNQYRQLTNNEYSDRYPCLQGNRIAWMSGEGDSAEIFAAILNPDSLLNVPYDPKPLITGDPPVIPPTDNGTSNDTSTKPPATQPGSSPEVTSKLIEPASRCFIGSCRAGCWQGMQDTKDTGCWYN